MPPARQQPHAQWAEAPRVAHRIDTFARQQHQRIGAAPARHGILDALVPGSAVGACQHHRNHLRVGGGGKPNAAPQQFLAQIGGIDQVAVMRHRQRAILCLDQKRLGVAQRGGTRSGIACMPDGIMALQRGQVRRRKNLRYQAVIFVHMHPKAIRNGDPSGLLAAVLQSVQPKKCHVGNRFIGSKNADNPARFVRPARSGQLIVCL